MWNLGWKASPVDISWRLEMLSTTTDVWVSSVQYTTCINEKQIFKLSVIFISLSVQSDLCPSDDLWKMQAPTS